MDIAESLKSEILKRGLTASVVARDTELPLSTVSEFLRGGRDISTAKASAIAEYLGFVFTMSQIRKREMKLYLEDIKTIDEAGYSLDDADTAAGMVRDLKSIEDAYGPWDQDDADMAARFVNDLRFIEEHCGDWSEDDANRASQFAEDLKWLETNGWVDWAEEDANMGRDFVADLKYLEQCGESPTEDRMADVRDFVASIKKKRR